MMCVSQRGWDLIREYEGLCLTPYICPAGKQTIGYGHAIKANESFETEITLEEAEMLLLRDAVEAENAVNRLIEVKLTQNQFDALVSFTFNLGAAALARSTLRKCLNSGKFEDFPREIMRWVYSGGRILEGLSRRRSAECKLFLEP